MLIRPILMPSLVALAQNESVQGWPFEKENPKILVPAGVFQMGSLRGDGDERPAKGYEGTELSAYFLSKTPVTVGQYRRFLAETAGVQFRAILSGGVPERPDQVIEAKRGESMEQLRERAATVFARERWSRIELLQATLRQIPEFTDNRKGDDYPIVGLTWEEARRFCRYYGGDLPTAAQMERVAKGRNGTDEYGTPIEKAIVSDNGANSTALVIGDEAEKRVNDFSLIDLGGNVWGMTLDRYEKDWFQRLPAKNPCNPLTDLKTQAVEVRGGSWFYFHGNARAANRYGVQLDSGLDFVGFRVAWTQE